MRAGILLHRLSGAVPGGGRRAATWLLAATFSCSAYAGPPYVTDDPEPTDLGRWENYGFVSGLAFGDGAQGQGGFDINYGGARDLQLSAVVSLAYNRIDGTAAQVGVADTELGAKYRFLHQRAGSWRPDVSLFPKLDLPTAGRRFGSRRVGFSIPLWMQKDIAGWSLFGGGGWRYNPGTGNRSYEFGGMALTRQVAKALSLGVELYHQTAAVIGDRSSSGLGVGASWQVAPRWSLIGSGGPLIEHRDTAGRYAFYVALEYHN